MQIDLLFLGLPVPGGALERGILDACFMQFDFRYSPENHLSPPGYILPPGLPAESPLHYREI